MISEHTFIWKKAVHVYPRVKITIQFHSNTWLFLQLYHGPQAANNDMALFCVSMQTVGQYLTAWHVGFSATHKGRQVHD